MNLNPCCGVQPEVLPKEQSRSGYDFQIVCPECGGWVAGTWLPEVYQIWNYGERWDPGLRLKPWTTLTNPNQG